MGVPRQRHTSNTKGYWRRRAHLARAWLLPLDPVASGGLALKSASASACARPSSFPSCPLLPPFSSSPLFCGGGAQGKGLEARVWLAARGFIGGARVSRGSRRHGRPANLGVRAGTRGGHPTARRWLGAGGRWSRVRRKREHGLVGDVGRLQARPLPAFCHDVEDGCRAREARRGRR